MSTDQSEQQVDGGFGGQTGAFNEQAGGEGGPQQNEQQVDGGNGGQTGAFNEQASEHHDEPVRFDHEPVVHEEPLHVSDEHSFEDAGHAAASESADAGHDDDTSHELHHS